MKFDLATENRVLRFANSTIASPCFFILLHSLQQSRMSLRTPRTLVKPAVRLWLRSHSSSSSPPTFVPNSHTSADTRIPYGDPSLASSAYLPRSPGTSAAEQVDRRATEETPELNPRQREIIEKIIRVDQAGELGANYIYRGQRAILGLGTDKKTTDLVQVSLPLIASTLKGRANSRVLCRLCGMGKRSISLHSTS